MFLSPVDIEGVFIRHTSMIYELKEGWVLLHVGNGKGEVPGSYQRAVA